MPRAVPVPCNANWHPPTHSHKSSYFKFTHSYSSSKNQEPIRFAYTDVLNQYDWGRLRLLMEQMQEGVGRSRKFLPLGFLFLPQQFKLLLFGINSFGALDQLLQLHILSWPSAGFIVPCKYCVHSWGRLKLLQRGFNRCGFNLFKVPRETALRWLKIARTLNECQ